MMKVLTIIYLVGVSICYGGGPVQRQYQGIPGLSLEPIKDAGDRVYPDSSNRENCENGETTEGEEVPGRGDTRAEVSDLIVEMQAKNFQAYIVPSADAHGSEYTEEADERREFITDFTGSAGTAVILDDGEGTRAMWTDGRYFLQADQELDCTWILMRAGEPGVPDIYEWVINMLPYGSNVGADARLFSSGWWESFEAAISPNLTLVVEELNNGMNIVDEVWETYDRPSYSNETIYIHEMMYAGQDWRDKILEAREAMENYGADLYITSMLDEPAWALNIRGADIPYNPVFRCYMILDRVASGSDIYVNAFIPDRYRIDADVFTQLALGNCNSTDPCVGIFDYYDFEEALVNRSNDNEIQTVLIPTTASYYVYDLVPEQKRLVADSPIMLEKAMKNEIESAQMRECHKKDATALYQFMYELEGIIASGENVTEMDAMEMLDNYRYDQPENRGLSFYTISAADKNSAVIHYSSSNDTNANITNESIYLLDSGGQYPDGTTDVTRTFHFGTPDDIMIEAYTRVLMGQIDYAALIFPKGFRKSDIDILTRRYLYEVGWDYNHSPYHGIGMFLYVHEDSSDEFELGWHGSDEPGYYEDGYFGVRLESQVAVINVTTKYDFNEISYGFETLTLYHYEANLINTTLLTQDHCDWINNYHAYINATMYPYLTNQTGLDDVADYMVTKTQPIDCIGRSI